MDEPSEESPSRQDHSPGRYFPTIQKPHTCDLPFLEDQIIDLAFDHCESLGLLDRRLHRNRIEFPISLGSRTSNRRSFASIENSELNSTPIRHPTHQAIKRIDLADEVALAEPPNGWIARHGSDRSETMSHKGDLSPHASRCGCSLAASVSAPHHNDIELHGVASSLAVE
jgi:hypothetical protein